MVKYVILPCPLHEIHVAMVNNIILPSQLFQSNMSSWSELLSCQVNFLKVRCRHEAICYLAMSTS